MANILTASAISGLKDHILRRVYSAQYKIGNTYYDRQIHNKGIGADGWVFIDISITPQSGGRVTITEVRILDANKEIFASKTDTQIIDNVQQGVFYRFKFDIKEVSV